MRPAGFWQVSVAEDRRFELLKGCPLHAFQVRTQRSRQNGPVRDVGFSGPAARAGHQRTQANEIIFETISVYRWPSRRTWSGLPLACLWRSVGVERGPAARARNGVEPTSR
jgi:hypothetical protein